MCRAMDEYRKKILQQGIEQKFTQLILKKVQKGFDVSQISEMLELEEDYVTSVVAKMSQ